MQIYFFEGKNVDVLPGLPPNTEINQTWKSLIDSVTSIISFKYFQSLDKIKLLHIWIIFFSGIDLWTYKSWFSSGCKLLQFFPDIGLFSFCRKWKLFYGGTRWKYFDFHMQNDLKQCKLLPVVFCKFFFRLVKQFFGYSGDCISFYLVFTFFM